MADAEFKSGRFLADAESESTESDAVELAGMYNYAIAKTISFTEIANDVINDFNERYETEFTYKLVGMALVNKLHSLSLFVPIMCSDAYACCFWSLHNLCDKIERGLVTDVLGFYPSIFFDEAEDMKSPAFTMRFGWRPEALLRVYDLGNTILEWAKVAWWNGNNWHAEDKVLKHVNYFYSQMLAAKEELESLEYVYTPKDVIMELYNGVVADAKKDLDTINGDMVHISEALMHFIVYGDSNFYAEALRRQESEDYPGFKIGSLDEYLESMLDK